ncbi:MAG: nucleotidyltransferase domain-containing protein [Sphingobium sp.]
MSVRPARLCGVESGGIRLYLERMTRDEVLSRIKPHEAELRSAGMTALYLFGSVARGEAGPVSDIDLSCDIGAEKPVGLLQFIGMQQRLEDMLGAKVDLVEDRCLIPAVAARARRDRIRIF